MFRVFRASELEHSNFKEKGVSHYPLDIIIIIIIIIIIYIYIAHIAEASKRLETEGRVEMT